MLKPRREWRSAAMIRQGKCFANARNSAYE